MTSPDDLVRLVSMWLSDDEVRVLDREVFLGLSHLGVCDLADAVLQEVKERRDLGDRSPKNSSCPPSSQPPWMCGGGSDGQADSVEGSEGCEQDSAPGGEDSQAAGSERGRPRRRPGKQPRAPGHGRKLELRVTAVIDHRAQRCAGCGVELDASAPFKAQSGFYVLDLQVGTADAPGLTVTHCKHRYGRTVCGCGHATVTKAGRAAAEQGWRVKLTEHCLVGPTLASLIVCLTMRMRLSRPRIREFLKDWLGVDVAAGTIDRCVHEAGRASEPLEELTKAVDRAREGPPERPLPEQYAKRPAEFKALCESCRDCPHKKLQQLAREFLNDWEAIWIVLQHPNLPLTNDEAEQVLRHLVIARKICQGTRSEEGTRAYALFATVIETCRKRKISPWPYVAQVIAERRKGNEAPRLPAAAA